MFSSSCFGALHQQIDSSTLLQELVKAFINPNIIDKRLFVLSGEEEYM
jgi:hypothetical protein